MAKKNKAKNKEEVVENTAEVLGEVVEETRAVEEHAEEFASVEVISENTDSEYSRKEIRAAMRKYSCGPRSAALRLDKQKTKV